MKTSITFLAVLFSAVASLALGDTFGSGADTFNIDFVNIGNPGNSADTTGSPIPAGKVDYTYRIGKYEISRGMVDTANTLEKALVLSQRERSQRSRLLREAIAGHQTSDWLKGQLRDLDISSHMKRIDSSSVA